MKDDELWSFFNRVWVWLQVLRCTVYDLPGPQKYETIMVLMAMTMVLGLSFYILLGFR